jgi:transcription elongation factor Elf1
LKNAFFVRIVKVIEHFFVCPRCGERISLLLDLSVAEQEYIEDCEVCCCPLEISYRADADGLLFFSSVSDEQR